MEGRSIFSLHGITGMLIATVLLLTILAILTVRSIAVQNENASNFYKIENEKLIQMISTENDKYLVDVK